MTKTIIILWNLSVAVGAALMSIDVAKAMWRVERFECILITALLGIISVRYLLRALAPMHLDIGSESTLTSFNFSWTEKE